MEGNFGVTIELLCWADILQIASWEQEKHSWAGYFEDSVVPIFTLRFSRIIIDSFQSVTSRWLQRTSPVDGTNASSF